MFPKITWVGAIILLKKVYKLYIQSRSKSTFAWAVMMHSSACLLNLNIYIYLFFLLTTIVTSQPFRFDIPTWLNNDYNSGQVIRKIDVPIFRLDGVVFMQRKVHLQTPRLMEESQETSFNRSDFNKVWRNYFYKKKGIQ